MALNWFRDSVWLQRMIELKHSCFIILLLLGFAFSGCSPNDTLRKGMDWMAPDEDEALAKKCISSLSMGDFETFKSMLDPQFVKPGMDSELEQVSKLLSHGQPLTVELVGCRVSSGSDKRRSQLTYQYQFEKSWVLATVTTDTVDGKQSVFGVNVEPIPKSLQELNAFTFSGKQIQHYVIFALIIIVPIFILWTAVLCVRTKIQRKWLWIVFILLGITKVSLNWSTGQMGFQPIAFQLPGAAMSKMGLHAPWVLSISFPLGAILFLRKRRRLRAIEDNDLANIESHVEHESSFHEER